MTCETCRQQLLPYLYDLLEPLVQEPDPVTRDAMKAIAARQ